MEKLIYIALTLTFLTGVTSDAQAGGERADEGVSSPSASVISKGEEQAGAGAGAAPAAESSEKKENWRSKLNPFPHKEEVVREIQGRE